VSKACVDIAYYRMLLKVLIDVDVASDATSRYLLAGDILIVVEGIHRYLVAAYVIYLLVLGI
jgi:hypothetical protein